MVRRRLRLRLGELVTRVQQRVFRLQNVDEGDKSCPILILGDGQGALGRGHGRGERLHTALLGPIARQRVLDIAQGAEDRKLVGEQRLLSLFLRRAHGGSIAPTSGKLATTMIKAKNSFRYFNSSPGRFA